MLKLLGEPTIDFLLQITQIVKMTMHVAWNCNARQRKIMKILLAVDKSNNNKNLSYCRETVRHESMPRTAEIDVTEMDVTNVTDGQTDVEMDYK